MSGHAELPRRTPSIDASAFVAAGAVVVGDVRIGARSSVWFQAVIRGDSDRIEIGERTNVQDLTMVHVDEGCPALIGNRVTIGHSAVIHGCVIEDDCLIGMGAIVLSGARVGAGSLVGAGALVRERQEIPPGSLVLGAPARVAGEIQPAHRGAITRGTEYYERLADSYRAAGLGAPAVGPARVPGLDVFVPGIAGELEWDRWLSILEESPRWARARYESAGAARWTAGAAGGGSSAHDVVVARLERDRAYEVPQLETALGTGRLPAGGAANPHGAAGTLQAWAALREALVACLRLTGPEAWMPGAPRDAAGESPAALVREATARDLAARRAILQALEAR